MSIPPQYSGKLLLKAEIPPEHLNKYFTPVPSIEKRFLRRRCKRCGNTASYKFSHMPHAACGKECLYCRNCIQMGRVLECEPLYQATSNHTWPQILNPCAWEGELTPAQQKAAARIIETIQSGGQLLVWAVCGAGKTEMLFPGVTAALEQGKRLCLATPRTDVVRELEPRLKAAFPDVPIDALYGDSPDKTGAAQFVIATTHQLLRFEEAFDVMIIDEVDAFPYHLDASLHFASRRAGKANGSVIQLTATPRKRQERKVKAKQLPVVFIPKRFHGAPLPVPQFKLSPLLKRKLANGELSATAITRITKQQQGPRQLLLFAPTIPAAESVAKRLAGEGYSTEYVHADDPDRSEKITAFRNKNFRILVTTTILERGVTFPSVDVFVLDASHHVFDAQALVQISGRAGRSPADPTGEVIFFHIGKSNAMLDARDAIVKMNKLGAKL
ncbi:DEAD/DEAH box helicase [Halobacillus salinarum]|uniref:DEAD/DEAH box helicase n=1 Tax=Halobacillus salinarum TaxID=2932257 RepID=A0ABY4ENS4_9BACI|nr:DEAD/DEAH box helicase [Halobacillus salinarum]UOQ45721.1 DEAD/DEAH box helicase [Halobacillus salinarum]